MSELIKESRELDFKSIRTEGIDFVNLEHRVIGHIKPAPSAKSYWLVPLIVVLALVILVAVIGFLYLAFDHSHTYGDGSLFGDTAPTVFDP